MDQPTTTYELPKPRVCCLSEQHSDSGSQSSLVGLTLLPHIEAETTMHAAARPPKKLDKLPISWPVQCSEFLLFFCCQWPAVIFHQVCTSVTSHYLYTIKLTNQVGGKQLVGRNHLSHRRSCPPLVACRECLVTAVKSQEFLKTSVHYYNIAKSASNTPGHQTIPPWEKYRPHGLIGAGWCDW